MKFKPSLRGFAPSHAEEISRLAAELRDQGHDIIALNIGQPRTGAPKEAIEAAVVAERSKHGYTSAGGLTELRQRIARYYQENTTSISLISASLSLSVLLARSI